MEKMFIVVREWENDGTRDDYEVGVELLGIFSSREKAIENLQKRNYKEWEYEIEEVSLDEAINFDLFCHHHMD